MDEFTVASRIRDRAGSERLAGPRSAASHTEDTGTVEHAVAFLPVSAALN